MDAFSAIRINIFFTGSIVEHGDIPVDSEGGGDTNPGSCTIA
jgi:hypothetical protein